MLYPHSLTLWRLAHNGHNSATGGVSQFNAVDVGEFQCAVTPTNSGATWRPRWIVTAPFDMLALFRKYAYYDGTIIEVFDRNFKDVTPTLPLNLWFIRNTEGKYNPFQRNIVNIADLEKPGIGTHEIHAPFERFPRVVEFSTARGNVRMLFEILQATAPIPDTGEEA